MISLSMYFEVHQPYRLRPYGFFDLGSDYYFDEASNRAIFEKVAHKCYRPTTRLLLDLVKRHPGDFRFTFSLTGTFVEQAKKWGPDILDLFRALADSGQVEFLSETYYHSLASIFSDDEFREQVRMHGDLMEQEFNYRPTSFRNTELIFNSHIAWLASDMGYKAICAEGAEQLLGWRSPNFLYTPRHSPNIRALLKNYRLSDDIAFRFSQKSWDEWPLTTEKFATWVHNVAGNGTNVNLFMDYETFGEHQWSDTGIFQFLEKMPEALTRHGDFHFRTVTEAARRHEPVGVIESDELVSWADQERDVSAWLGNSMQREAAHAIFDLAPEIKATNDPHLLHVWRMLQTSDHFYYMSTKFWNDGDVHKYFSPYGTPHEAYVYYMNVLQDLRKKISERAA